MAKIATLAVPVFICGCASEHYDFMDHTALVLRPSHHQALLAYSFGGGEEASRDNTGDRRTVAATLATAMAVNDNPLPKLNTDNMDFKGGRFYFHLAREK